MTYTATIRQRGQLTIPDRVRETLGWLQTGEIVGIDVDDDEVRIRPHSKLVRDVDWDRLWAGLKRCRSFKSRSKQMPLSEFIIQDREKHRV